MNLSKKEQLILDELIQEGRTQFWKSGMNSRFSMISLNLILEKNAFRVGNGLLINAKEFSNEEFGDTLEVLVEAGKIDGFERQASKLYKIDLKEAHLDYDNKL